MQRSVGTYALDLCREKPVGIATRDERSFPKIPGLQVSRL
jgi:hypothetical protein